MKKRLLKILLPVLLIIIAASFLVFGATGTFGWFTDQDKLIDNNIKAGTVNPEVRGVAFSVTNAKPGVWDGPSGTITFFNHTNNSTLPVKYRIYDELTGESTGGFYDKIQIKVERKEGSSWVQYYSGWLKDLYIDPSICPAMASVSSGSSHDWQISLMVDPSAGNIYQGAIATFNLVFDSTQDNNTGWDQ
jgi:hypothetical protein